MIRGLFIFFLIFTSLPSHTMGKFTCRKKFFDNHRVKSEAGETIQSSSKKYSVKENNRPDEKINSRRSFYKKNKTAK